MSVKELEKHLTEKRASEIAAHDKAKRNYLKKRDIFIRETVTRFMAAKELLTSLKQDALGQGHELYDELHEVYDRKKKDVQSFQLVTEDGKYKLELESCPRGNLDESAQIGIDMIKEVLKAKFQERNKTLYKIIDSVLMRNKKGDYDERLVAKLRKHEEDINDPDFTKGLDIISKAYYVTGTSLYARAYAKNDKTQKWDDISIQFSGL